MAADPLWINASAGAPAYSAAEMRQAMGLAVMYDGRNMGVRKGVRPGGNQLFVSLAGSTITVQPGLCALDPALTTPQGSYWVAIPVAETHTLTAADPTNPRKDIVVARVYDHDEDASGLRLARSEYLVGTPAGSPAEPALPASAIKLALIDVPASGGGAAVVTDRRTSTVATGGILPVADQTERDALGTPYDGQTVWRRDLHLAEVRDTTWRNLTPWRARQTLSGSAASVTFSSIPSSLRSLRVLYTVRSDAAVNVQLLKMRINGDSGAQYSFSIIQGANTTVSASSLGAETSGYCGLSLGASAAAGVYSSGVIYLAGWDSPHAAALGWTFTAQALGTGLANFFSHSGGGVYSPTGAHTSLTLFPEAGSFVTGSDFQLEGMT